MNAGSIFNCDTPKTRCKRLETGSASALLTKRGFAHLLETLLGRRGLVREQRRIGSRRLSGRQQADDFLELERRIRRVTELHVVDGAGHVQHDVDTFRLRLQADVENRLDAHRIVKADGAGIDVCRSSRRRPVVLR